jgi:hypothetical protein
MLSIQIYRHAGTWCFTDEARGLLHEPFVLGIPQIIDNLISKNFNNEQIEEYSILFSSNEFPQCLNKLQKVNEEYGGAWYELIKEEKSETEQKGWLCPATLKFFSTFPEVIYFNLNPCK